MAERDLLEKIEALEEELQRLKTTQLRHHTLLVGTDENEEKGLVYRVREMEYDWRGRPNNGGGYKAKLHETYEFNKSVKIWMSGLKWAFSFLGITTLGGIIALVQWLLSLR
jgi:hypothetical protein